MLRVTQTVTEVLRQPSNAEVRASQVATEVVRVPATRTAHISQIALDVLRPNVSEQNTSQQPVVVIVTG